MRSTTLTTYICSLFSAFLLLSCGQPRSEQLGKRLNAHWEAMRWRSAGAASSMVEPEERVAYLQKITKQLDQMRVVDFSVVNVTVAKAKDQATSVVAYSYYTLNENDLRTGQEVQTWRYSSKDGWMLTVDGKQP